MSANAKISGNWKDVSDIQCKVSSTWIPIDAGYAKVSGVWEQFYSAAPPRMQATGGTITDVGGFRYHTFTSSGTFEVIANPTEVQYLVVAGGGAAGDHSTRDGTGTGTGGGGAGGFLALAFTPSVTGYSVVVGAGGSRIIDDSGGVGSNSSVFGQTALGGGGGGMRDAGPRDTGNGSGGGVGFPTTIGGSGTPGQGFDGGDSATNVFGGSGGGGASEEGSFSSSNTGTNGGNGETWLDGTAYAGGGGGGGGFDSSGGLGGTGGGGDGGSNKSSGDNALSNTGGGGGGASGENEAGGQGGSGIVIIRYPRGDSSIYSVTDTHSFASHGSDNISRTMTLDSNTDREVWLVLLTIAGINTLNTPTVTIDGNSMAPIASETFDDTSMFFFRYQDDGALGTSATITTNFDFSSTHSAYIVFTSSPTDTTFDSYGASAGGSTPTSGTLNTSSSGWSFYIATAQNSTAATSIPNFGNEGFFDYGTGEHLAYGFNSAEDDGTVGVEFANFGGTNNDNLMLALSRTKF